jgi:hypothetical protein
VQVAAPGILAVIDTLKARDLEPFWRLLAEPGRTTVVHAGREEFGFILHAIRARPSNLFDVQVAAGLVDHDFPAGYASIVRRFLNLPTFQASGRAMKRPSLSCSPCSVMGGMRLRNMWKLSRIFAPLGRMPRMKRFSHSCVLPRKTSFPEPCEHLTFTSKSP